MTKIGIICEYNPFHNGHKYHIDKIKEMFNDSIIILVMSSCFTQRGDISILNKWDKTKIALDNNIDLVVELPTYFTIQSSDIFAKGAVSILNYLDVDYIVFGSETNDVDKLKKVASIQDTKEYNNEVKKLMKEGISYKNALSKALENFNIDNNINSNDILGISYIKEINRLNSKIIPLTIKRTSDFNMNEIKGNIISANTIRKNLDNIDIKKYVPKNALANYYKVDYYNLIKYKIYSNYRNLNIFNLVDEGIENRILKNIDKSNTLDEFINLIKCKRYNVNKIRRMLISILINFTKEDSNNFRVISYIRILGFNKNGQVYLNQIKKKINIPIYTKFNKELENELYITKIYSSIVNDKKLIKEELKGLVIKN